MTDDPQDTEYNGYSIKILCLDNKNLKASSSFIDVFNNNEINTEPLIQSQHTEALITDWCLYSNAKDNQEILTKIDELKILLFLGFNNGDLSVYSINLGKRDQRKIKFLEGYHKDSIISLKISNDNEYLISAGLDNKLNSYYINFNEIFTKEDLKFNQKSEKCLRGLDIDDLEENIQMAGDNGVVYMYNLNKQEIYHEINTWKDSGPIYNVKYDYGCNNFGACSQKGIFYIYSAHDSQLIFQKNFNKPISNFVWRADGTEVFLVDKKYDVPPKEQKLFQEDNFGTGSFLIRLAWHTNKVEYVKKISSNDIWSVDLSSDEILIIIGDNYGDLFLIQANTGIILYRYQVLHTNFINCVKFLKQESNNKLIQTASSDSTAKLLKVNKRLGLTNKKKKDDRKDSYEESDPLCFDYNKGDRLQQTDSDIELEVLYTFKKFSLNWLRTIQTTSDENIIGFGDYDGIIHQFDLKTKLNLKNFRTSLNWVMNMKFFSSKQKLLAVGKTKLKEKIFQIDYSTSVSNNTVLSRASRTKISHICFDLMKDMFYAISEDGWLLIYDNFKNRLISKQKMHEEKVNAFQIINTQISHQNNRSSAIGNTQTKIYTVSDDRSLGVYSVPLEILQKIFYVEENIGGNCFLDTDKKICLDDIQNSQVFKRENLEGEGLNSIGVHYSGNQIVIGTYNGSLLIWKDYRHNKLKQIKTKIHDGCIDKILVTRNSQYFMTYSGWDFKLKIFDFEEFGNMATIDFEISGLVASEIVQMKILGYENYDKNWLENFGYRKDEMVMSESKPRFEDNHQIIADECSIKILLLENLERVEVIYSIDTSSLCAEGLRSFDCSFDGRFLALGFEYYNIMVYDLLNRQKLVWERNLDSHDEKVLYGVNQIRFIENSYNLIVADDYGSLEKILFIPKDAQ